MKRLVALVLTMLIFIPGALFSAPVVKDKSSIGFATRQMGVPVAGSFKRFDADVRFDPKDAGKGSASITIYMDEVDAGSDDGTVEIKRKPWFDVKGHPKAWFLSTSLKELGPGRYEVAGKMTIKGRTRDVIAPVTVKKEGGLWLFEGAFAINRLDFSIGEGPWADTGTVDDKVEVRFRLLLTATGKK
ncbi:MAG TPA: polyisoprenoid-binding protein [Deltaproteobacteria bacterium]|nr:polyisoprenoid-binding protein [Deltaproteobacteria bacterium]